MTPGGRQSSVWIALNPSHRIIDRSNQVLFRLCPAKTRVMPKQRSNLPLGLTA
jgi:hypothetical protein